ncbi:MAG: hypothetical protein AAGA27_00440 [Pseudomonadota bacterium]
MNKKLFLVSTTFVTLMLSSGAYAQDSLFLPKDGFSDLQSVKATVDLSPDIMHPGKVGRLTVKLPTNASEDRTFTFTTDSNLHFFPHNSCTISTGDKTCSVFVSAGFKNIVGEHTIKVTTAEGSITNPELKLTVNANVATKLYLGSIDQNTSPILECNISDNGPQLSSCNALDLSSIVGNNNQTALTGGALLTASNETTYLYLSGVSGENGRQMVRCQITAHGVTADTCKILNITDVDKPMHIAFNTFTTSSSSTTYAYISNDSKYIYQCTVDEQGEINNCTIQADGEFVNAAGLDTKTLAGTTYIYVGNGSNSVNYITRCTLNSGTGELSDCTHLDGGGKIFISPGHLTVNHISENLYVANVDEQNAGNNNIVACSLNNNGELTDCTVVSGLAVVYPGNIVPTNVNIDGNDSVFLYVGNQSSQKSSADMGTIRGCQLLSDKLLSCNSYGDTVDIKISDLDSSFTGGVDGIIAY